MVLKKIKIDSNKINIKYKNLQSSESSVKSIDILLEIGDMKMKNKETILKLYEMFADEIYKEVPQDKEETAHYLELEDKLQDSLNDEQKQILEELRNYDNERVEKVYKAMFVFAFSLSTKLFIEGLEGKKHE